MKNKTIPGNIIVYDHRSYEDDWYLLELVIGNIHKTKILTFIWEIAEEASYHKIDVHPLREVRRDSTGIMRIS